MALMYLLNLFEFKVSASSSPIEMSSSEDKAEDVSEEDTERIIFSKNFDCSTTFPITSDEFPPEIILVISSSSLIRDARKPAIPVTKIIKRKRNNLFFWNMR